MPYLPHIRPDHDETLIARLAVDDLDTPDAATARKLVADCPACAELLTDLTLIASATADLPAPARTHDFRLTEADAARLRPSSWRGLIARFRSPDLAFTRPLAVGMATLGLAGLVLASLPAGFGGVGGSTASLPEAALNTTAGPVQAQDAAGAPGAGALAPLGGPEIATDGKAASPAPVPVDRGAAVASQGNGSRDASASPGVIALPAPASSAAAATAEPSTAVSEETGSAPGPTPLVVLSLTMLVIGLVLGGLRLLAGRVV